MIHEFTKSLLCSYADAVTYDPNTDREYFVLPHEESMPFNDFLDIIQGKRNTPHAHYISLQNDSLHTEFSALKDDIDEEISWCSEALGKKPDAVNFWMGNDKSITSLHKDPYENCYAVIRGEKTFVLIPPSEYYCLHGNRKRSNYSTTQKDWILMHVSSRIHFSNSHLFSFNGFDPT